MPMIWPDADPYRERLKPVDAAELLTAIGRAEKELSAAAEQAERMGFPPFDHGVLGRLREAQACVRSIIPAVRKHE